MKTIFMAFFIIATLVSYVYPSLGQKDVDDEPLVNSGHEFDTLDTISPASEDYNIHMLKNMSPKYITYVKTCHDKMGPSGGAKCNDDVLEEILTNKPVSRECCQKVVKAGKECYMETIKFIFRLYQLKRFASQVSFKTNKVWNRCSIEVESPSSSQKNYVIFCGLQEIQVSSPEENELLNNYADYGRKTYNEFSTWCK
ncbi:hypothetical protein YC2023_006122 [Brassica napus]